MLILSFESILTLSFERALLYFESMLLYFESILILFFESFERAFLYFESILLYFESMLLYFESYFLLGTCTFVFWKYTCVFCHNACFRLHWNINTARAKKKWQLISTSKMQTSLLLRMPPTLIFVWGWRCHVGLGWTTGWFLGCEVAYCRVLQSWSTVKNATWNSWFSAMWKFQSDDVMSTLELEPVFWE